ncbi:PhoX family protein [Tuwongella immobilis]|uniref:Phosphatase n=1 Tax=Tuwongella immobilis TaxID=692036 RepID=A0A6C2YWP3_9BACT|nr:alkaline phosphatase PhoX [Tuwongella immobilis]VIP05255.1 Uncharacterized protein OS=Isosphaera pallida (strain ATCC 43644 / DSM 9630 / IS1B) GN=Isop_2021 PE=4 SV=1: DUF839 [Tuwongella immobilis]VTS07866.1 Uncharacterized protein OS=Isosphaera pallida (strain ATCC 43644 / DSM 9630 / IS1B) GN=Isop_2021 PE=4 SV=1: DUF839 [Tuwongella immobilis]
MSLTRRDFLTYLGVGSYSLLRNPPITSAAPAQFPTPKRKSSPPNWFQPIAPSSEDLLRVPDQYSAQVILSWDDPIGLPDHATGPQRFGFNNDFIAYFPINALEGGKNSQEGLLWVNHEYTNPLFVSGYFAPASGAAPKKTVEQIRAEKRSVGGSVVHVKWDGTAWKHVPSSQYNRRITALYPEIMLTGAASSKIPFGIGTLGNCSGGRTPWMTALSCEENYPDFNDIEKGFRWKDVASEAIDERQYGWVVEIDPFGELPPQKHSSLGRFKHENAAVTVSAGGKLVVYMGDDEMDQFFYKYVSHDSYNPAASRADQRKLLSHGTLYVADLMNGRWLALDYDRNKAKFDKAGLKSQADVLIHTRQAAAALKATPLDRCEDCEVHPLDGSIYVAMTNNAKHGNLYGQIVRFVEANDDAASESFQYEIFLAGGPKTGLASPDNLAFRKNGDLIVVCDMSSDKLNRGAYRPFGNNGLFVVPTRGDSAGDAFQFASGPNEAELTGPWFTEDESTLFLSVQHPGEETTDLSTPTSHWPHGGTQLPRPSIVAIRGPFGG